MLTKPSRVDTETPEIAFDLLRGGRVDAWAVDPSDAPGVLRRSCRDNRVVHVPGSYGANYPSAGGAERPGWRGS